MLAGMNEHSPIIDPARANPAMMDPRRGPFRSQRVFNNILQGILGASEDAYKGFYLYCQLGQIGDFVR